MALPPKFKFAMECMFNDTMDANVCTIKYRGKYFDGPKLQFENESSEVLGQVTSLEPNDVQFSTEIDNTAKTNPIVEMDVLINVNLQGHSGFQPGGSLNFYLIPATGSTYATEGLMPFYVWDVFLQANLDRWAVINVRQ
jgi:hypothetical protein